MENSLGLKSGEIKDIVKVVLKDALAQLAPFPSPETYVNAGAEALLAKLASIPDEKLVELAAERHCMLRFGYHLAVAQPDEAYACHTVAQDILSLRQPILAARAVRHEAEAIEQARKEERERIFVEVEERSRPMNTNMTGVNLSREEWQSLKANVD